MNESREKALETSYKLKLKSIDLVKIFIINKHFVLKSFCALIRNLNTFCTEICDITSNCRKIIHHLTADNKNEQRKKQQTNFN